ncbi:UNVERIFIED_CONTAM: hypothetical protein GTU68_065102 [Idotea baltica]|nr:hypothetical protein [Idotea baltica]
MLFNSFGFLYFFPTVVLLYFIFPKKLRWVWLLIISYYFYMSWNPTYAILIFISTLITYLSGILIENAKKDKKKIYVGLSFILNLAILIGFKYANFMIENVAWVTEIIGLKWKKPALNILLPVGISFYTFQALSYTMDVYRGTITATRNFGKYALFVSFFPQLVAGPIEKAAHLLPQFDSVKKFDYHRIKDGLIMMALGFFKKMVIADRLAILVNTVYNNPTEYAGFEIVIATIFFAFQILCDFSGYTDIAIGAAKILGFDLMKNFDRPYFSTSIPEFWRRWHISLGAWFRDYLYFPLGGNRVSTIKKYRNILIVFVTSGLWHGASWNFLIWGFLHGVYYVLDIALTPIVQGLNVRVRELYKRIFQLLLTFTLVCFAWIFFRANSLSDALYLIKNIFVFNPEVVLKNGMYEMGLDRREFKVALIAIAALLSFDFIEGKLSFYNLLRKQHIIFRWLFYVILILVILIFGVYGGNEKAPFIYFQF